MWLAVSTFPLASTIDFSAAWLLHVSWGARPAARHVHVVVGLGPLCAWSLQSTYSQHTISVQSTYSQHTVNTQSTHSQHNQQSVVNRMTSVQNLMEESFKKDLLLLINIFNVVKNSAGIVPKWYELPHFVDYVDCMLTVC